MGYWWNKFTDIIAELTQTKYYGFFEGDSHPYLLRMTQLYATGSAKLEHIFDSDSRVFFPYIETDNHSIETPEGKARPFPILSLDIVDGEDSTQYDLTDFLETMTFYHVKGYPVPSIAHIMAAWQLFSRVVVDQSRFTARYITDEGDTVEVNLSNTDPLVKEKTPDTDTTITSGENTPVAAAEETGNESVSQEVKEE